MVRIAVIDDYQNVASTLADWDSLPEGTQVDFYQDHLTDMDALVERLRDTTSSSLCVSGQCFTPSFWTPCLTCACSPAPGEATRTASTSPTPQNAALC